MRLPALSLIICALSLWHSAPSAARAGASPLSPTAGQAVPGPVNTSRPLAGQAVLQAEATEEMAAAVSDTAAVLPVPARAWDQLLRQYVAEPDAQGLARFDYAALKASRGDYIILTDYIAYLEAQDPEAMETAEAIAYWANLYNAVTVQLIVDHYPVRSIKKIKSGLFSAGPWGKKLVSVGGRELSLDNIEHDILRRDYPSPHIHYMVNCASVGCPNLKDGLWRAETLREDQEEAARAFINSPRGVEMTSDGLILSSIYKWFREDFGDDKAGLLSHIRAFAAPELARAIDDGAGIDGYDYDWSLNGVHDNE